MDSSSLQKVLDAQAKQFEKLMQAQEEKAQKQQEESEKRYKELLEAMKPKEGEASAGAHLISIYFRLSSVLFCYFTTCLNFGIKYLIVNSSLQLKSITNW